MITRELSDSITSAIRGTVNEVCVSEGRWMAVVWKVENGRLTMIKAGMHDFPKDDYTEALSQLATRMHDTVKSDNKPEEPLPLADFLKDEQFGGLVEKDNGEEPCDG